MTSDSSVSFTFIATRTAIVATMFAAFCTVRVTSSVTSAFV